MADISPAELKQRLANGEKPLIVDVREDWEYQEQNIGALNIPLGTLPDRHEELEAHKTDEIIVHCRSGARSATAKAFLSQQGYTNVRNLTGGILAYNS